MPEERNQQLNGDELQLQLRPHRLAQQEPEEVKTECETQSTVPVQHIASPEQDLATSPAVPASPVGVGSPTTLELTPPPLGPPPEYQEIYPVQPHYWNGQPWPPPPRPPPSPWPVHSRPVVSFHPSTDYPTTNVHMIGGQIITPSRVPTTVKCFFGTVSYLMIFSIVCGFAYALIVTVYI